MKLGQVEIKSREEIALMREAGRIVCEILDELEQAVAPGVTTWDLDALAEKLIYQKGARPAFKGYHGFPACLCASINHEVLHGIPSKRRSLQEGDLMKLDFGVVYRGFFGDSARTVPVGKVTAEALALLDGGAPAPRPGGTGGENTAPSSLASAASPVRVTDGLSVEEALVHEALPLRQAVA